MADRKYSVEEIDVMREHLTWIVAPGGRSQTADKIIEDRLRTYMLNGTRPEELEPAAQRAKDAFFQLMQERHREMRGLALDAGDKSLEG